MYRIKEKKLKRFKGQGTGFQIESYTVYIPEIGADTWESLTDGELYDIEDAKALINVHVFNSDDSNDKIIDYNPK